MRSKDKTKQQLLDELALLHQRITQLERSEVERSKTSTINVTQGYIGVAGKKYWLGGTTSGYMGIDFSHTTNGNLVVVGLAPWSAFGTFAEVLVIFTRGVFYGQS